MVGYVTATGNLFTFDRSLYGLSGVSLHGLPKDHQKLIESVQIFPENSQAYMSQLKDAYNNLASADLSKEDLANIWLIWPLTRHLLGLLYTSRAEKKLELDRLMRESSFDQPTFNEKLEKMRVISEKINTFEGEATEPTLRYAQQIIARAASILYWERFHKKLVAITYDRYNEDLHAPYTPGNIQTLAYFGDTPSQPYGPYSETGMLPPDNWDIVMDFSQFGSTDETAASRFISLLESTQKTVQVALKSKGLKLDGVVFLILILLMLLVSVPLIYVGSTALRDLNDVLKTSTSFMPWLIWGSIGLTVAIIAGPPIVRAISGERV